MKPGVHNRSSLFLMELIIAILFFSISSAVCLRIFANAHLMSIEAAELQHAVTESSNVAELIRYDLISASHQLSVQYPDADVEHALSALPYSSFQIYYDSDWNPCKSSDCVYLLTGVFSTSSDLLVKGNLSVTTTEGAFIYELPLQFYLGSEASYE